MRYFLKIFSLLASIVENIHNKQKVLINWVE